MEGMLQIHHGQHNFKSFIVEKEMVPNSEIGNELEDQTKEGYN